MIRHGIAGVAEALGMPEATLTDLRTAVTEACTNTVLHAYEPGETGPMLVEATVEGDMLRVSVADSGQGIRPRPNIERSSLRLGLALISALSARFEIAGGADTGTRVTMYFPLTETGGAGNGTGGFATSGDYDPRDTELSVSDQRLLMPVLSRLVRAIAARHDLPMERISDAVLLADAIAAEDPRAADGSPVHIRVEDGDNRINLKVGPFLPGGAEQLRERLDIPGIGGSLTNLADNVEVAAANPDDPEGGEYLALGFTVPDRDRSAA